MRRKTITPPIPQPSLRQRLGITVDSSLILSPCPQCNADNHRITAVGKGFQACCQSCGFKNEPQTTDYGAASDWNVTTV